MKYNHKYAWPYKSFKLILNLSYSWTLKIVEIVEIILMSKRKNMCFDLLILYHFYSVLNRHEYPCNFKNLLYAICDHIA